VLPDTSPDTVLTERELIVLGALMRTGSPARIASDLVVSVNTVKTQLRSIYRKLEVSSRDQAIAVALDRHLLAEHDR
jgi:LuxR family maltose regulon positive regulatory protein